MHGNAILRDQRNRLYQALRDQGASSLEVLEESRKLDALVLRYYRTVTGGRPAKVLSPEPLREVLQEVDPDNSDAVEIGPDELVGEDPEP